MNEQTPQKKKSIIRTEAALPFLIVALVTFIYFHFFFDYHLKKAFEFAGYELLGAEVDIDKVETSFFNGTFQVKGIQVTNSEKPAFNMVSIGDIRFGVLWDGLLRARLVVEEMAAEQIEIGTARKFPGRVKPPEPPKPPIDPNKPSALQKEAKEFQTKAAGQLEKKYNDNVIGDLAGLLGGTSSDVQLDKIQDSLPSKIKLKELEAEYSQKQKKWDEKIKSLPKNQEIQALGDRLSKVKTKDFKTPQELQQSLQAISDIVKDADTKYKSVQSIATELSDDLKKMDQDTKDLDAMVKKDTADLENRFHLPKLDAKSLTESIFYPYFAPYLNKFNTYKNLVQKYAPPNLMKKDKPDEAELAMQPRPRAKGTTYEFGRLNSYPLFWIKKISISSQAGATPNSGNIKGLITDVTSNQVLVGRPTVATIQGDFPTMQVSEFAAKLIIDNTKATSLVSYQFSVGSYAIEGRDLIQSPDAQVAFKKANAEVSSKGELVGLKDFTFEINNQIKNVDYSISAKNPMVDEILKGVFTGLPAITVDATGKGELPGIDLSVNSNLGPELQKGFEKQLQKKIDEARGKLQAFINDQVGTEKAKFEGELNKNKAQAEGEIKKVQDQLDSEKSKGQAKGDQAKNDATSQAKKNVEDQVKKALGPGGDKKLDDLKKQLGL